MVSVASAEVPVPPASLMPTAELEACGELVPAAVSDTLPAVTLARSSMCVAMLPLVVADRSTVPISMSVTATRWASTVACAVRVALRAAAPEPRATVSLLPM